MTWQIMISDSNKAVSASTAFGDNNEQESCFSEDKVGSIERREEVGGKSATLFMHGRGFHHGLPVECDSSSQAGQSKAVARRAGFVVKWGQRGSKEAQIVSTFILTQISTRQHVESSQLVFQMIVGKLARLLNSKLLIYSYHRRRGGGQAEGCMMGMRSLEGNSTSWPLLVASLTTCILSKHILLDQHDGSGSWGPE